MRQPTPAIPRMPDPRSRGQALAEFALVLPVMMLVLLIVVDFGRLYQSWIQLNNAARVGANYAAMTAQTFTGSDPTYQSLVRREMSGAGCQLPAVFPPAATFSPNTNLGSTASLSLTCNFRFITPVIGDTFGGSGTLPVGANAQFPVRVGVVYNVPNSAPVVPPP